jgi:hypothetical protein
VKDGCGDVPMAPVVTPQTNPGSYLWPYGAVHECRVLNGVAHLFGDVDVSFILLLETDTGPVLARVDYVGITAGRQYRAAAAEVGTAGIDLSDEDVARLEEAVTRRGGRQPTPWVIHYGDG